MKCLQMSVERAQHKRHIYVFIARIIIESTTHWALIMITEIYSNHQFLHITKRCERGWGSLCFISHKMNFFFSKNNLELRNNSGFLRKGGWIISIFLCVCLKTHGCFDLASKLSSPQVYLDAQRNAYVHFQLKTTLHNELLTSNNFYSNPLWWKRDGKNQMNPLECPTMQNNMRKSLEQQSMTTHFLH